MKNARIQDLTLGIITPLHRPPGGRWSRTLSHYGIRSCRQRQRSELRQISQDWSCLSFLLKNFTRLPIC